MSSPRAGRVDLHVHTSASDGSLSPREVVSLARRTGLAAVAISDHDTVAGLPEATASGRELGVEIVPAVELTAYDGRREIHIVGLFVDSSREETVATIGEIRDVRRTRMRGMVEKLKGMGVEVDSEEVLAEATEGAVGRPHLARVLVRRGYASDVPDAFDRLIGDRSPAYVRKHELSVAEAIGLVRDLGGLPVLAHPGVSQADERIPGYAEAGLAGLEVRHAKHTRAQERHYARIAERRGLAASGGSDFHGPDTSQAELGVPQIALSVLDALRERHAALTRIQR